MRFLRTNTACRITVGPAFDKTDGVTPETALTVTSCKLTFMVDDGNVPTLVIDAAPTASGGNNDMVHVTGDDAGFYDLELTAANTNYLGRAMLAITDAATHCPIFHEFMILPAVVYDAMVLGTDNLQVDTVQVTGTAQTARDLGASVLISSGTGTGQISLAAGLVTLAGVTHTGAVIPTVTTVDTLTTYAGNTPQTADHTANIAAIVADTNELQTDWVNGGRLDLILDARSSQSSVDDLPTNAELATALGTADDAVLAAIAALNDITTGEVRTELAVELARIDAAVSTRATPAQVATELGTYDGPTKAELDTAIDALPTAAENAAALMDLADGIETSITLRQAVRLILAASAGELSGAATTMITIRNVGDTKDRITATVDSSGNRSAVTVDGT